MLQELELQVLEVYRGLDVAVTEFARMTGLACPEACGHCCHSQKVEATVLECIPLAFELFRTLQAGLLLERLEKCGKERQCILYRPDFIQAGLWGCSQYPFRPVVCRLFGFAGNRDRQGMERLAMCRVMKESFERKKAVSAVEDNNGRLPLFSEAGLRITALHPGLGTVRLPVNRALLEALQKVGMILDLAGQLQAVPENAPDHLPESVSHSKI